MNGKTAPGDVASAANTASTEPVTAGADVHGGEVRKEPERRAVLPATHRSLQSWLLIGSGIAAGAALAFFFGVPLVLGPVIPAHPITRTDLVQTLVASGHVETPFRISISSQIIGVVAAIPVAEGQQVKAGDVLIRFDDHEAQASVVLAEGQLAQAEARVRQVRDLTLPSANQSLIEARATLVNMQQIFERASKLLADGVSTRVSFEEATKNLDIARGQVRSAELNVFTNSPGGADFTVAETQSAQAHATLQAAQFRLGYTIIRAARDGLLIWRDVEVGNVVQPGKELMRLSPVGEVQIAVQIDEKNLGLIALDQRALASADAFSKDNFPATVTFINPAIDLARASVEVKLSVASPPAYLRQDMTVSVDIEVARRPQAIIVSIGDLHDLGTGKPWLLKAQDGFARRQHVTVGLISAGKVEILTGLSVGDVVVPASSNLKDGNRLRLRTLAPTQP
jgi:HlyD family secretion protein